MSEPLQALTEDQTLQQSSLENQTATSSSLTMEDSTRGGPSLFWFGSTTREARGPSSTTCRTAGACTSGWCLAERCSYVLHAEEDGASRLMSSTVVLGLEDGNTLVRLTVPELAWQSCT